MASGLKLQDVELNTYENQFKKAGSPLVGLVLKIITKNDREKLIIEKTFKKEEYKHEDFVEAFPVKEGRIGLLKYSGTTDDGRPLRKVIIFLWTPLTSPPSERMNYSSCFGTVRNELTGIDMCLQCDDKSDISFEKIESEVKSKFK